MSTPRRPVIGVTAALEDARWGVWHKPVVLLPAEYAAVLRAVGADPVLLPPAPTGSPVGGVVDVLDGLLLSGGADIEPARYGAAPHPTVTVVRPDRDASELALVRAARERDLPVLGVCRGMQLMAVEAGGRLTQHLPEAVGHRRHRPAPATYGHHGARFAPGSLAAELLGEESQVNSYHHQCVADPGRLVVTGWADDATIEAVEESGRRFALGVQSHPEVEGDVRVFAGLVAAACLARAG